MSMILLLGLQVAVAGPVPVDFDLAKYRRSLSCESTSPYDVVVCGRRHSERNRLLPVEGDYEVGPFMAQTNIGNMQAGIATEAVHFSEGSAHNGMVSSRMMVGLKMPF